MLLFLARHADAGVPDPARWPGDADRPLTDEGRAIQGGVSDRLAWSSLSPFVVISSPLLRARQTAEIIAKACKVTEPTVIADALAAPVDLDAVGAAMAPALSKERIALVGHSPWLDELASILLTGSASGMRIEFDKSSIMVLRADAIVPRAASLVMFLHG